MRRDGTANRERILVAAEQVFGRSGTSGSTDDVARLAQVGIATVFRHFPTKTELVEATALRYLERMQAEVRRHADDADRVGALAAVMRILVSTGPTKVTLLNVALDGTEELSDTITAAVQTIRDVVADILRAAQAAGTIRADVTGAEIFTLARALAHVATAPNEEVVDNAIGIVLDGLIERR